MKIIIILIRMILKVLILMKKILNIILIIIIIIIVIMIVMMIMIMMRIMMILCKLIMKLIFLIKKLFTTNNLSLYKIKKYLKDITNLIPVFYDMCENSCICYTGQYEFYQNCPICNSTRFDTKGKAKKIMPYLSIKNRLQIQFNDKNRAKELLYRHEYILNKEQNDNDLDDIFDGKIYKELVEENLFNDKRDIVFTASCDGYQIFRQKTDDYWLFLM